MSLHTLANHLQTAGRGDDKVLVHMTPKEVSGLQALAMAHGGSLTINPQTGLPEAGFLSSLLPMLAGFALAPLTAGTSLAFLGATPFASALTVGAATGLATGSLKKGLMAGLGAYGGAGLGAGLSAAGTAGATGATQSAASSAANEALKGQIISQAPAGAINAGGLSALPAAAAPTPFSVISANPAGLPSVASQISATAPSAAPIASAVPTAVPTVPAVSNAVTTAAPAAPPSAWDKIGAGAQKSFSSMDNISKLNDAASAAAPYYKTAAMGSVMMQNQADQQEAMEKAAAEAAKKNQGMIRPYEFSREVNQNVFDTGAPIWSDQPGSSAEKLYFTDTFTPLKPYKAPGPEYKAAGGLTALAVGGPVETMAAQNAVGANLMYPQANINTPIYSNPSVQRPEAVNVVAPSADVGVGGYTGEQRFAGGGDTKALKTKGQYTYDYNPATSTFTQTGRPEYDIPKGSSPFARAIAQAMTPKNPMPENGTTFGGVAAPVGGMQQMQQPMYQAAPIQPYQSPEQQLDLGGFYNDMNAQMSAMGYAGGGLSHLGDYSDGGRLLKGPGDGVSDSIPAVIGKRQPARLADGEFVVPARIVSELGNGSTEAGARKLYSMMDRVQKARGKSVGKNKVAVDSRTDKYLPA